MSFARSLFAVTLLLTASAPGLAQPPQAPAQGRAVSETRQFAVYVNGKEAGSSTLVIVEEDNGKTYVKGMVSVKIPGILFGYSFSCTSEEWWLKDRLTNLSATAVENGKKTDVSATAEADRVLLTVNGQTRAVSWEVWPASFWKLADRRFHNKTVPIFEPDTGKDMTGKLEYVGAEQMRVGGGTEECYHFRVTGVPSPTELWFDKSHRLVRQEFTESGQRTIVQLMSRKS